MSARHNATSSSSLLNVSIVSMFVYHHIQIKKMERCLLRVLFFPSFVRKIYSYLFNCKHNSILSDREMPTHPQTKAHTININNDNYGESISLYGKESITSEDIVGNLITHTHTYSYNDLILM